MVMVHKVIHLINTASSGIPDLNIPNIPHKNDPFKKEEDDNDATRIRPGVHEPDKNDPTRIEPLPILPSIPGPSEESN